MPGLIGEAWRYMQDLMKDHRSKRGPAHVANAAPRIPRDPTLAVEVDFAQNVAPLVGDGMMAEELYDTPTEPFGRPVLVGWWIVPADTYVKLAQELEAE